MILKTLVSLSKLLWIFNANAPTKAGHGTIKRIKTNTWIERTHTYFAAVNSASISIHFQSSLSWNLLFMGFTTCFPSGRGQKVYYRFFLTWRAHQKLYNDLESIDLAKLNTWLLWNFSAEFNIFKFVSTWKVTKGHNPA